MTQEIFAAVAVMVRAEADIIEHMADGLESGVSPLIIAQAARETAADMRQTALTIEGKATDAT